VKIDVDTIPRKLYCTIFHHFGERGDLVPGVAHHLIMAKVPQTKASIES